MSMKGMSGFRVAAAAFLTLSFGASFGSTAAPSVQQALLRQDWGRVLSLLEKDSASAADPVARLIAGQACLATNRDNQAFILFMATEKEDALAWKAWAVALTKENPNNGLAFYLLGDAQARTGDFNGAEASFTNALDINPELGLALTARGVVRTLAERGDEAYLDVVRATQVQPGRADAWASLGCYEVLQQNAEGAEDAFNEALKLDPSFALAYNGRGCARYGLGEPDEAHLDFEMAATLCPFLDLTEANQAFVLALVARKVDEKMPAERKPGTTLETHSQTMVVDIPGIWSQGIGRPEKWAPFLIGDQGYERFNIRHEGAKNLVAEPGVTILLPQNASSEQLEQYLGPVHDAIAAGKSVYVKLDMNMGFLRYMSPVSGPAEMRWAGTVADALAGRARSDRPDICILGNMHSAGTVVALEHMNVKLFNLKPA